jgi:hypothetical protein
MTLEFTKYDMVHRLWCRDRVRQLIQPIGRDFIRSFHKGFFGNPKLLVIKDLFLFNNKGQLVQ